MSDKSRIVNRALGKQPKIGPFPANQLLPLLIVLVLSYIVKQVFALSWINASLFAGWLLGSIWTIGGERHWRFLLKLVRVPYFVRGGICYKPLLDCQEKQRR